MLFIIASIIALTSASDELIAAAIENYGHVDSYQVTLRTKTNDSPEEIMFFYKRPGHVRMEFIRPHKGAALVYDPSSKKVRIRPFRFLKFFVFSLSPDNRLVKSSKGHRVDESDIGALLKEVSRLLSHGKSRKLKDETIGKKRVVRVSVEGEDDFTVGDIHRYHLWLDKETFLPLRVSAYDTGGALIEEVFMDDLKINIEFPDDFFDL